MAWQSAFATLLDNTHQKKDQNALNGESRAHAKLLIIVIFVQGQRVSLSFSVLLLGDKIRRQMQMEELF